MNRALRMLPVVGLVIGVVAINERASGVVNGQVPAVDDTRFDAVAAFSLTDWLNGVTFEHNHFGNGTLIAPDTMVMAKHLLPSNAEYGTQPPSGYYSFRFRRNPDGSLGTIAQGWQSFYHVPVVKFIYPDQRRYPDVVFAKLASPVTHITPMGVAPQGKVAALAVGASTITFAGWGTTGPGFGEGFEGRLKYASQPLFMIDCRSISVRSFNDPSNPCGCGPNLYDSGGALLIGGEEGSPYKIAGIISTTGGGGMVTPITEPPEVEPAASDRRYDPICAFGPTSWLSEEAPGQPDDGDDYAHEHRFSGVLIAPDEVVLPVEALKCPNPNFTMYSEASPPPAGLFSVRFRRRVDGGVGSVGAGWASYYHVAVQSYEMDTGPMGTRLVIAHLASPVTHIAPMVVAPTTTVNALTTGSAMRLGGWAWGDGGVTAGLRTRADSVASKSCSDVTVVGNTSGFSSWCGFRSYDTGTAFVIERRRALYSATPIDDLPLFLDAAATEDVNVPRIMESDAGARRFSTGELQGAHMVIATRFELVGLKRFWSDTSGQLVRASQLFDECYYADCSRPPIGPVDGCADVNEDGVIDEEDAAIIERRYGDCVDCADCFCDLNHDCVVDFLDWRSWARQHEAGRSPCRCDFNQDGVVDAADVQYVVDHYGPCDCLDACEADLNGDRVVDSADLAIVLDPPATVCSY